MKPPKAIKEARERLESTNWLAALAEEIPALKDKKAWEIVPLPSDVKAIESRLVFVRKMKADGSVDKYKVRLVAKGFQEGHLDNVYSPVLDFSTVRLVLAVMGQEGGIIHHMDFKSAFLNGKFEKEESVYLNPPEGLHLGVKHERL